MYKVIGSDRQIYGPATLEQLRQWLGEGRINASTLTQAEGAADWKPLSTFPEFGFPPVISTPPPVSLPPQQHQSADSKFATIGLIFGILSIVGCCIPFVFGVLGIVFSSVALSREQPTAAGYPDTSHRSVAMAGLILSILGLLMHVFLIFGLLGTGTIFRHRWRAW
jgi:hypothetical protein